MGMDTKCSDWQAAGIINIAGAEGLAAGLFVFDFYSATAGLTGRFVFKGAGIGVGGDGSGTTAGDIGPFTAFSSIDCDEAFSIWDLNGAWGRITSAGAGMGLTFGVTYITAAPRWSIFKSYFHSQNAGGLSTGAGAGAFALVGNWRFKKVVHTQPSTPSGGNDMA